MGSSFIDINADCRPDLLLNTVGNNATKKHEYYIWTNKGFCLTKVKDVPAYFTMPSFMDLNNRGTNDMIMLQQNSGTSNIMVNIFRNKHTTDLSKTLCTQNEDKLEFPYPGFDEDLSSSNKDRLIYVLNADSNLFLYEDANDASAPPVLMIGDMDLDGIPDMS